MFVHQRHTIINTKETFPLIDALLRVCTYRLSANSSPHCVIIENGNRPTVMRCFQWSYHFASLSLAFLLFLLLCITLLFGIFIQSICVPNISIFRMQFNVETEQQTVCFLTGLIRTKMFPTQNCLRSRATDLCRTGTRAGISTGKSETSHADRTILPATQKCSSEIPN